MNGSLHMSIDKMIVATDVVVEKVQSGKPQVLLVERKAPPFQGQWALPGGIVELEEEVLTAAVRELQEEVSLEAQRSDLSFIDYFDAPDRDPRGRAISFAFGWTPASEVEAQAGSDAAKAQWFALDNLPELAFDHRSIIARWEER